MIALFGGLITLAIFVAHFAGRSKERVIFCACIIALNWIQFAMPWIYAPASPAFLLPLIGVYADHESIWAVCDLLSLLAIGWVCRAEHWSPLVWGPYLSMLAMIAAAWVTGMEYVEYDHILNAALLVQLAAIFAIGGGGCADYLSARWRCFCAMVHRPALRRVSNHAATEAEG